MYTPKRRDSRRRARNATEPESGPSDCSCQRGVAAQPPPHFQAATGTVQWFTLEPTIARAPASNCSALQQQHAVLTTNQLTGAGLLPCKSKSALDREVAAVPASGLLAGSQARRQTHYCRIRGRRHDAHAPITRDSVSTSAGTYVARLRYQIRTYSALRAPRRVAMRARATRVRRARAIRQHQPGYCTRGLREQATENS